jgi:uncharacterized protein DUF3563
MKAMNFRLEAPGMPGAWEEAQLRSPRKTVAAKKDPARPSLLDRLDRWLWRQEAREREAYLADSKDIYELEERMRRIERSVGPRYY